MVESTPLLRERGGDLTEGSNPSRSALTPIQFIWVGVRAFEGDEIPTHRAMGSNATRALCARPSENLPPEEEAARNSRACR